MEKQMDVIVIGAGPVGLFCANELTRHGLRCRIVDKKTGFSDKSKALGLHIRTLDVLDDCGFADEIFKQGHKVDGALIKSQGNVLVDATFAHIEANRHFLIDLPQDKTERILGAGLVDKGIAVEWQTELSMLIQTADGVIATFAKADGSVEEVPASWAIACDGARSTVRHLVNMPFEGAEYQQNWWLADLLIDWQLPENRMVFYVSKDGPMACFPMGEKRYRLVMTAPALNEVEPDLADITNAFKLRSCEPASLSNPRWITKFYIHHRQIQQYRVQNLFFAGDAAHIHSPMGGQGLNTGIQDVYNLVWKLALVDKKLAPASLLDSYHLERYPVGKDVLKKTDSMTTMLVITNPVAIALRNALMVIMMSFNVIKNKLIRELAELTISYKNSPIVKNLSKNKRLRAGYFLGNFELNNNKNNTVSLDKIVQGTAHHLFLFEGLKFDNIDSLIALTNSIDKKYPAVIIPHIVLRHEQLVQDCQAHVWLDNDQYVHELYKIHQATAIILRPDKYLGFVQAPVSEAGLINYLAKIFISNNQ